MPNFGVPELVIILVIVILIFGVGRIGKIAGEMGKGIRAFRTGISGKDEDETKQETETKTSEKTKVD
jgi:sec-independent protein translocase protein TatA